MSTITGLPAHMVLLHVVVSLVPLTAALLILCAVWPAARRRLVWLVLTLSAVTLVATPPTIAAGEWLADTGKFTESPQLDAHMAAGEYGLYMAVALALAAALLGGLHLAQVRGHSVGSLARLGIMAAVIALSGASISMIHAIGSTGTEAAWGGLLSPSEDH